MRTYLANVRRFAAAWAAIEAASDGAEYNTRWTVRAPLDDLNTSLDAMRLLVCTRCDRHGYYAKPGDPHVAVTCLHDGVARYDARTGEVWAR